MLHNRSQTTSKRISVTIQGIVQGVGFRPFVYRLAVSAGLTGWVRNTPSGVFLEAQGPEDHLNAFREDLREKAPPLAVITSIESAEIPTTDESAFIILKSGEGENSIQIAPDGDVCPDCLRELFDPSDRRYRYPFINCTNCGPRYTIITGVPYDRPFTTMSSFPSAPAAGPSTKIRWTGASMPSRLPVRSADHVWSFLTKEGKPLPETL